MMCTCMCECILKPAQKYAYIIHTNSGNEILKKTKEDTKKNHRAQLQRLPIYTLMQEKNKNIACISK